MACLGSELFSKGHQCEFHRMKEFVEISRLCVVILRPRNGSEATCLRGYLILIQCNVPKMKLLDKVKATQYLTTKEVITPFTFCNIICDERGVGAIVFILFLPDYHHYLSSVIICSWFSISTCELLLNKACIGICATFSIAVINFISSIRALKVNKSMASQLNIWLVRDKDYKASLMTPKKLVGHDCQVSTTALHASQFYYQIKNYNDYLFPKSTYLTALLSEKQITPLHISRNEH
uniref:Uncharacterized protein n=1 Tax=Glossina pallidipes TaxID=7398 RepID=A0A1B0A368_GLOPL